jgi:AraC-like DNA-binding protein
LRASGTAPLWAALGAEDAELTAGGAGGRLAAESLAHVLAVHLLRHVQAPRRPARGRDGALPPGRLRAVVEEVALRAGFSDQSQFCHHFKRIVGVTPGQFQKSARIT